MLNSEKIMAQRSFIVLLLLTLYMALFAHSAYAQSAPSGLTAAPGSGSVTLSWSTYSGETSYDLYRSTTSGGEGGTPVATGLPTYTNTYTDSGLTNGTTYYYQLTAVVSGSQTAKSNETRATPGSTLLAAPSLKGTGSSGQAVLTWSPVTGATSYTLVQTFNGMGSSTIMDYVGITGTSYTATGLTNTNTYQYVVYAVSVNGMGHASNTVSVLPGGTTPGATTLSATEASSSSVSLSWGALSGASSYDVYRATTSGGEGAAPYKTGITSASTTDTGLTSRTTYYYEVCGVGTAGEGPLSNEASATPGVSPLAAPSLKGSAGSGGTVLTWSSISGATAYNLYPSTSGSPTLYQIGVTGTTYTDSSAVNGTAYNYAVRATSVNGQGSSSNTVTITAGASTLPASAGLWVNTQQYAPYLTIMWSPVTGATGYDLYRGSTSGGEGPAPYLSNVSASTLPDGMMYMDTSLTMGNTYYYKVVPVNTGGEGALSNEGSGTVGAGSLAAPANLTPTPAPNNGNTISLTWSPVTGATSYLILRGQNPVMYANLNYTAISVGLNATSYTDTNVQYGYIYSYMVCAVDTAGAGTFSTSANTALYGFQIIPNPATVTVTHGTIGALSIQGLPSGNYIGTIQLSGTGFPSGVTGFFFPLKFTFQVPNPNWTPFAAGYPSQDNYAIMCTNLDIAAAVTAPPGTYPITVTATSTGTDGFYYTVPATLIIN